MIPAIHYITTIYTYILVHPLALVSSTNTTEILEGTTPPPPLNNSAVSEISSVFISRGAAMGVAPPPGSWGQTLPLTLEANLSPRISRRFLSAVGLATPEVRS